MRADRMMLGVMGLSLLLAGCAGRDDVRRPPLRFSPVTPAGEPVGVPTPQEAAFRRDLVAWAQRADTGGDGFLDAGELAADTDRAFVAFDGDGNGAVTPAELTRYRIASPFKPPEPSERDRRRERKLEAEADAIEEQTGRPVRRGRARVSLDPVMSADANADFRVTRDELRAQTTDWLAELDRDGDARLTPEELTEGMLDFQKKADALARRR